LLDLVRDVGHHLYRPAEVIAATLFGDDRVVNAPGRELFSFVNVSEVYRS
jgi:hypothetical protein